MMAQAFAVLIRFFLCLILMEMMAVVKAECNGKKGINKPCDNDAECCSTSCDSTNKKCLCSKAKQFCEEDFDCCQVSTAEAEAVSCSPASDDPQETSHTCQG